MFSDQDWLAIWLTFKLATVVTVVLLVISTPLALWLAYSNGRLKTFVSALVAMPLILPPTVLGFYLLIFMGPNGPLGQMVNFLGLESLPFSFLGLVLASLLYSLPFVVQPLVSAFSSIGRRPFELAAVLGASPWDRFWNVLVPLAKPGFITAAVLGFAHTVGEFGVILMIGGSIPGETKVASIQIYEHVELMQYSNAHGLSALMMIFSFCVLLWAYCLQNKFRNRSVLGL